MASIAAMAMNTAPEIRETLSPKLRRFSAVVSSNAQNCNQEMNVLSFAKNALGSTLTLISFAFFLGVGAKFAEDEGIDTIGSSLTRRGKIRATPDFTLLFSDE
jgi:hypothetical protein